MRAPTRPRRSTLAAPAAVLLLSAAGCSGPAVFLDPEADLPFYERVGVLPFASLARDRLAGEKVANVFFTELLAAGFAEVVDMGQLAAATVRVRGGTPITKPWSTADLARLGEEAGIQGVFQGTVRDYDMVQVGRQSFPMISLELRLLDTATGRLVWSASLTRRGGPAFPLFGWTETHTLGELTARACREALESLR